MTDTDHGDITERRRDTVSGYRGGFLNGLCTGALIGAAAGVLFAPRIHAALRNHRSVWKDTGAGAREAVTDTFRDATTRVGAVVDNLHQKGREFYGKALKTAARGVEHVNERATEAQAEPDHRAAVTTPTPP